MQVKALERPSPSEGRETRSSHSVERLISVILADKAPDPLQFVTYGSAL